MSYSGGSGSGGHAARGIPGGRGGTRGIGLGRGGRVSTRGRGSSSGSVSADMNTYNSYDAGTPADNENDDEDQPVEEQYQPVQRSVANSASGRVSNNNRSQQSVTEEENAGHVISKVFFENEQLLIDNMREKEEFFETAGLLVINEDEKDIKGKYINLR